MDTNTTTILVGLLTFVSTIAGTVIAYVFNRWEQAKQRRATLRRDVYLPVADAVTGMVHGLMSLLDLQVPRKDVIEKVGVWGAAVTRVHMVATPTTISRAADLQRAFLDAVAIVNSARTPMENRELEISSVAAEEASLETQLGSIRDAMRNAQGDRSTQGDSTAFGNAYRAHQIVREKWTLAHAHWLRLSIEQKQEFVALMRELMSRFEKLLGVQALLLASIRVELEGDEALPLITEETAKTNAVGVRAFADAIPVIEKVIENLQRELAGLEHKQAPT